MLLDARQEPITETSLADFFRKRLTEYAQSLRPPPHEDTCWYLGNLFDRYGRSEHLFTYIDGRMSLQPLALLYSDALHAWSEYERCLLLQRLGDMPLFLGALFPRRLASYGIHKDYFIGMGGSAYDNLGDSARQNRHIFAELARTFARILEMVADPCLRREPLATEDALALYQRWQSTGDVMAQRQLQALGIEIVGSERLH